jgi:hypothetical protein
MRRAEIGPKIYTEWGLGESPQRLKGALTDELATAA